MDGGGTQISTSPSQRWRQISWLWMPSGIRTPLCMIYISRGSLVHHWLSLWMETDKMLLCSIRAIKRYFSRTQQFRSECSGLFIFVTKRKEWAFWNTILFWFRLLISQPLMWTAGQSRSRLTKYERYVLHFSSERTVQASRYWRLVLGHYRQISQPLTYEMSPTGIWTPSPSTLCWLLKRLCILLARMAPV